MNPPRSEGIDFITSHLTIYKKKEKYTGLLVWILLAEMLTLVFLSMTYKHSGTLTGASTDPLQTISIIIRVISIHFNVGSLGSLLGLFYDHRGIFLD